MPESQFCVKLRQAWLIMALVCMAPAFLPGQTSDTFTNGAGTGFWSTAGNWSAGLPGASNNVLITGSGSAASVSEDVSATINNLTLNSANNWGLTNGKVLTIDGNSISNAGHMTLNSTGSFTELLIGSAAVTLTGGGSVTMSNNANNYIFGAATADTLTNQETIQGAGNIGNGRMTLVNSGTINANQSAGLTIAANGGATNTGTLEATGGNSLTLSGTTVTNTGGKVLANTGSLKLINTTINGGAVTLTGASLLQLTNGIIHSSSTLTNSSTGVIESLAGTNTLGGTVVNPTGGLIKIDNGSVLNLENGSYPTLGAVQLNSTGSFTELVVNGAGVTLSGGSVTMSNNANNYIFGAATADTLTNQETIQGAGNIGNGRMTLVNSGTINANQSAGLTIAANGGATNTGTLEATAGDSLTLSGTTVTNTGGKVLANTGSLKLINTTINGGAVTLTGASLLQLTNGIIHSSSTLTNSSTGVIESLAGTNTLGGTVVNPTGGLIKIDNGSVLNLENGSYPTLGAVQLNSTGSFTELVVNGAGVTLSGGSVTMSNNANNYIFGAATADTLTNQETIQGAGNIGNGRMTLVNSGTINANQSAGLTIAANGGATNTGTLEATAGDSLTLSGTTVTNTGGKVLANTGSLKLINTTINGGAVTLTGASLLQLTNGIIHSSSTLTNSSTGVIESLAGTNTLGGTVVNPTGGLIKIDNGSVLNLENGSYPTLGAVQLNSTGSFTELVVNGAGVTLSGGSVTMSNNANNYIFGAATADTLTNQETIQGAGNIGNGRMTLVNSGTINANQSAGMTIAANGGATNTGTLEATAGNSLTLSGTTVTNTGGKVLANTGSLKLINTTINGGAVTLTGASLLQLTNGIIHSSSTLTNSSTGVIESLAGTNTLGGTVVNPTGGLIKIDNGSVLNLENGSYPTLGAVQLNSTGSFTELVVNGAGVTLSGGSVTMSNNANNYIFGAATADTLTNQETIQGAGNIGNGRMTLVNSGTINANQSAGMTIAANGGATNTGTLEATAGNSLTLSGTTVTNTGGKVLANTGSLKLINTTINGGAVTLTGASLLQLTNGIIHSSSTLTNSSTGVIESLAGTNTLGGTVVNPTGGLIKIDNGSVLNLENGSYPTPGAVQLNSTGSFTELVVNGAGVTLSGGSVTMSNNANNYIFGAATADTLTNQETIQGAGNIGNGRMTLVNSGTINANQSAGIVISTSGTFTNSGTLQVGSADTMHVFGGPFTNFAGTTLTGGTYNTSGTLKIDQLGTTSGEIVTNAAHITLNGASSSFLDSASKDSLSNLATNATGSGFTISGGRNFTTIGNFTNNGTLTVGGGSKFTVNGNLTNFSGTTLTGGAYSVTGSLQFNGANIVTNAANISLTGTSSQILNQTSGNGLANFTTNATSGVFSVLGGRVFTTPGAFTNNGSLTVSGAGSRFTSGGTANFANKGTFTIASAANETATGTTGSFTNNGTLTIGTGSTFGAGGAFTNFAGTTLTGGVYMVTGTMQFPGANIVTNAANITLSGTASKILNSTTSASGLANFAANASSGIFSVQSGRIFTTAGSFSNAGGLIIGTGSGFTVGGTGSFTQTAGSTKDDGTLTLPSTGTLSLLSGSLLGKGGITGAMISSAIVDPGDSATATGVLKETGAYTQKTTGALNISITGTVAGTQYDQMNPSTATLSGTLNVSRPTSFVPSVGSTFKIMNFTSATGQFSTVNGLAINSTEHFTITYQPTDVLLTVVSGAASASTSQETDARVMRAAGNAARPSGAGLTSYTRNVAKPAVAALSARSNVLMPHIASLVSPAPVRPLVAVQPTTSLASSHATVLPRFSEPALSGTGLPSGQVNLARGLRNRVMNPNFVEYRLDLLPLLSKNSGRTLRELWRHPWDPKAVSPVYMSYVANH